MRKRVDHDATQEVSSSQLVPDAKPPAFTGSKNDASMWMQAPVSADDFVGLPKKKAGSRGGRGLVIGVFAVLLLGVTAAGAYYAIVRPPDLQPAASVRNEPAASPAPAPPTPAPAVAPAVADAGAEVATASADAGAVDGDAGVGSAAALNADAVSAADPAIKKKPAKKRTTKKKKATKKKTSSKRR